MSTLDVAVMAPDEELYERRARVLTLRNAGSTFTQIAERINAERILAGLDPLGMTTFRKDHQAALRDVAAASRDDLIAEHRSVLLDMRRAHYGAALNGDIDSTRIVISTLEREARMFGIDAPTQVALGVSEIDFAERMYAAIVGMGLQPPKEIVDGTRRARDEDVIEAELVDGDVEPVGGPLPFDLGTGADDEDTPDVDTAQRWSNL